jgi:drug/metabolite transporter (DMT)-like permease
VVTTGTELEPTPSGSTPAGFGAALGAVVVWGLGNAIIAKAPLNGMAIATYRLWLGAALYLVILYGSGRRLSLDSFRYGWPGGIAFSADICAFFLAVKHTTLADATTIGALQPLLILFVAGSLFGEKVSRRHIVCTVVALAGIVVVVEGSATGNGHVTFFGEAMAVLSLFGWVGYFIASKQARRHLDTLEYMTVIMITGAIVVTPLAAFTGQLGGHSGRLSWVGFGWIALVVTLPGSGHVLVNWAHNHTTITTTSLLTLLMPVISAAAGGWWLDQHIDGLQALGIAIVLAALVFVILGDTRAAAIERDTLEQPLG